MTISAQDHHQCEFGDFLRQCFVRIRKMLLLLIPILFILAYLYATRNFDYWRKRGIPFEKPVPFLGNVPLVLFRKCIGTYMKDLYAKSSGPLYGFFVFDQPFLLVRDPEIMKHILVKDFHMFDDRTIATNMEADPIGCQTLFALHNPAWRKVRRVMTMAFSSGKLKQMFPLMTEVGKDFIKYVEKFDGEPLEGKPLTLKFSTDVIASCAFGVKGFSFEKEESQFYYAATKIFTFDWSRGIQATCYFVAPFLVGLFKMKFLPKVSTEFFQKVFWDVFNSKRESGAIRHDLIDSLLEIRKDDQNLIFALNDELTVAQAYQFIVAGYETSGSTAFFTLYELALQDDIQKRLRNEIFDVCQKHGGLTYDAVLEMTYLDMIISEVLRKYPIVPFLDRRANGDYKIPDTDVTIEKGTPIYIPSLGLHYNPQFFPDPKKFDPERFTPERKANMPKMQYLPFGEGPRSCIGARFGVLSSKLAVIFIVSEFDVLTTDNIPLDVHFDPRGFLLAPVERIYLRFKKINSTVKAF